MYKQITDLFFKESWPGVSQLPDFSKITFPDTQGVLYREMVPEVKKECITSFRNSVISRKKYRNKLNLCYWFFGVFYFLI